MMLLRNRRRPEWPGINMTIFSFTKWQFVISSNGLSITRWQFVISSTGFSIAECQVLKSSTRLPDLKRQFAISTNRQPQAKVQFNISSQVSRMHRENLKIVSAALCITAILFKQTDGKTINSDDSSLCFP